MKSLSTSGFTIIELMLVIAISSLLTVGIIVGFGTSINTQRYHDSVTSLQSLVQEQFSNVNNVSNSNNTLSCDASSGTPVLTNAAGTPNGKSNCAILGKLITTSDGKNINIYNVIGALLSGSVSDNINSFNVIYSPMSDVQSYNLEWGSSIKKTDGVTNSAFSILIVRLPASGVIRTFVKQDGAITDNLALRSLVNAVNASQQLTMCVKSDGSISSDKSAVVVKVGAVSASGIEIQGESGESTSGCH